MELFQAHAWEFEFDPELVENDDVFYKGKLGDHSGPSGKIFRQFNKNLSVCYVPLLRH